MFALAGYVERMEEGQMGRQLRHAFENCHTFGKSFSMNIYFRDIELAKNKTDFWYFRIPHIHITWMGIAKISVFILFYKKG